MKDSLRQQYFDEMARTREKWLAHGFERIDYALQQTGALTGLQALFDQRGIDELSYLVFDAIETSSGTPAPVRTRYVLPLYDLHDEDAIEETEAQVSPGIAVIEVLGNGERQLDIQFGLNPAQMRKIGYRTDAVLREDQEPPRPEWWTLHRDAYDMTQPYDLTGNIQDQVDALSGEEDYQGVLWSVYSDGMQEGALRDDRIERVVFESESCMRDTVVQEWESGQDNDPVQVGLAKLGSMIDHRIGL